MANKYLSTGTDALNKDAFNITKPLIRYSNKPLETSGFFANATDAGNYAKNDDMAYIGQELTVFDTETVTNAYKYFISNTNKITRLLDERDIPTLFNNTGLTIGDKFSINSAGTLLEITGTVKATEYLDANGKAIGGKCYKIKVDDKETKDDFDLIDSITDTTPIGTIVIIERETSIGTTKTAYSLSTDNNWEAFNGNYSAESVFLEENMIITESFGNYKVPTNGTYEVQCAGKSIKSFLENALSADDETIWVSDESGPTGTVFRNLTTEGEVGSAVKKPESDKYYDYTITNGTYKYGTWNSTTNTANFTDKDPGITYTLESYVSTGTYPEVFTDSAQTITIKHKGLQRSGVKKYPVSRKGVKLDTKLSDAFKSDATLVAAKTTSETVKFTGWRYQIYYGKSSTFTKNSSCSTNSTKTVYVSLNKGEVYYIATKSSLNSSITVNKKDAFGGYEPGAASVSISTPSSIYIKPQNKAKTNVESLIVDSITSTNYAAEYDLFTITAIDSGEYEFKIAKEG